MIKLAYHFKCDVPGCPIESKDNIGDVNHRMSIPELPIPNGWHYLDHRIVCNAHSVVIDKKWVDATPESAALDDEPFVDVSPVVRTIVNPVKAQKRKKK